MDNSPVVNSERSFVLKRLSELHVLIFGPKLPTLHDASTYFAYAKMLRDKFKEGIDYSCHPRNPFFCIDPYLPKVTRELALHANQNSLASKDKEKIMSDWQRELDISDIWGFMDETDMDSVKRMVQILILRLRNLPAFTGELSFLEHGKQLIMAEWEFFIVDNSADIRDFNKVMEKMYDWGDKILDVNGNERRCCLFTIEDKNVAIT